MRINEISVKTLALSPLEDGGTGSRKEWILCSDSPSGCPSSWAGPCSGSRTSHAPTLGSRILDRGVSHLQFSKAQKNKVPSSVDGAVSLFPQTHRERQREREELGERGTQKDILCLRLQSLSGRWGGDPSSLHGNTMLMG